MLFYAGWPVDIAVHKFLQDKTQREIHKATGCDWGGNKINENIRKLLS